MTDNNYDDELDDTQEELTFQEMDINKVKDKIPTYESTKLCEMIVCDRYFGCYKEIALSCMEELAKRRIAGDTFRFESYIEKSLSELPKLEFVVPDLRDVLRQVIGRKASR